MRTMDRSTMDSVLPDWAKFCHLGDFLCPLGNSFLQKPRYLVVTVLCSILGDFCWNQAKFWTNHLVTLNGLKLNDLNLTCCWSRFSSTKQTNQVQMKKPMKHSVCCLLVALDRSKNKPSLDNVGQFFCSNSLPLYSIRRARSPLWSHSRLISSAVINLGNIKF